MPFTKDDFWGIFDHLEAESEDERILEECLEKTEEKSERLVVKCQSLLSQLNELEEEITRISGSEAGLIKAGEVEFSEHRCCMVKSRRDELCEDLSRMIGYKKYLNERSLKNLF